MRNAVFAHGNFNLHTGVIDLAQHLLDAANWLAKQRRWLGQLHHHDLPGLGCARSTFGNQDILTIALVFRRDQPDTAFMQQAANDGVGRTLKDFGYPAFGPVFPIVPHDACLDAVFVQHRTHLVGRQVYVGLAVVTLDKAMAVAVTENRAVEFSEKTGRCARVVAAALAAGLMSCFDKSLLIESCKEFFGVWKAANDRFMNQELIRVCRRNMKGILLAGALGPVDVMVHC